MEYSGKVTADHPRGMVIDPIPDCIQQITVLDVQWSSCPVEVEDEVRDLWQDDERLGNDVSIYKWDEENDAEKYPVIAEYLKSRGVSKCWIHWWW